MPIVARTCAIDGTRSVLLEALAHVLGGAIERPSPAAECPD
jgi:hypothetical protein